MSTKDPFAGRGKAFEEEHFRKREEQLVEKLRAKAAAMAERREMASATGIDREEIIAELQELGFNRETVVLVHLVPLVEVAWADGGVSEAERQLILDAAEKRSIVPGHAAHAKLLEMLATRPSDEVFGQALNIIRLLMKAAHEDSWIAPETFVGYCREIAEASGGFLGFGKVSADESALLDRIASQLERDHAAGAKKVVDRG